MGTKLWTPKSGQGISGALVLPPGAVPPPEKVYRCTVLGCEKRFPESQKQQWRRHVVAHAKRDDDEIQASQRAQESNAFTGIGDPERLLYNRRRLAERGKVKL
jgi:tetraacyldisaccharide-1-P 4'-kinase